MQWDGHRRFIRMVEEGPSDEGTPEQVPKAVRKTVGAEPGGRGNSCAVLRAFRGQQGPSVFGRGERGDSGKSSGPR